MLRSVVPGDYDVNFSLYKLQSKLLWDHIRGCARWLLGRPVPRVCSWVGIHGTKVHEARALRVHVKASRDVHRMRTHEIYVQLAETGWKQPICIRKVLDGF